MTVLVTDGQWIGLVLLAAMGSVILLAALGLAKMAGRDTYPQPETDVIDANTLPIYDAAVRAIRERGGLVADGEWLP